MVSFESTFIVFRYQFITDVVVGAVNQFIGFDAGQPELVCLDYFRLTAIADCMGEILNTKHE